MSGPKGLGDGCISGPKRVWVLPNMIGVGVGVWVHTQGFLGLGSSVSRPRGVWVGFGVRPKRIGFGSFRVRTQNGFRCGSFPIQTQMGLGLGPSMSGPKGV